MCYIWEEGEHTDDVDICPTPSAAVVLVREFQVMVAASQLLLG